MGVTGLWTVVQPCARPIKLETLNKKRLAVDASIWIYQFLKAVRDKEGNALRNSHVVGFFRRICKLLFFGIKPVFVFDGGAPVLKRQTISSRKARREGRREDAVRTAGKLLAVQMQRRAEEEDARRKAERDRPVVEEEEEVPDELVYVEELNMTAQERKQARSFKKKDAYHLPDLDVSLDQMGAPNDPRIMSQEELEEYARQFHTGEDINIYDFSKIDFNSPFFISLPASDRYNILNAARLRSRLRMGYSKDQLDTMFPDRMAFSKFQIERVRERNELTTRLMNLNGMNGEEAMLGDGGRVAGERGKEYVLVKNDGVEGGWALGVVSSRGEGERNKPIDVDKIGVEFKGEEESDEEEGFEDIPIEGLNRLPKSRKRPTGVNEDEGDFDRIRKRRREVYEARRKEAAPEEPVDEDPDSLFFTDDGVAVRAERNAREIQQLFEDDQNTSDEDEELAKAIAMSLEQPEHEDEDEASQPSIPEPRFLGPNPDKPLEFNARNARAGRDFAHQANLRARQPETRPVINFDDQEALHLDAALEESRKSKYKSPSRPRANGSSSPKQAAAQNGVSAPSSPAQEPFSKPVESTPKKRLFKGPLPFESLDLGSSMLKRKEKAVEEDAGGFEVENPAEKKAAAPLPPWFSGDIGVDHAKQRAVQDDQFRGDDPFRRPEQVKPKPVLHKQKTGEVVDLDAPKEVDSEVVEIGSEGESDDDDDVVMQEVVPVDSEVRMGDVADLTRAEPPRSGIPSNREELVDGEGINPKRVAEAPAKVTSPVEEEVNWSESDYGKEDQREEVDGGDRKEISEPINEDVDPASPVGGHVQPLESESPSPEFENVGLAESTAAPQPSTTMPTPSQAPAPLPVDNSFDNAPVDESLPAITSATMLPPSEDIPRPTDVSFDNAPMADDAALIPAHEPADDDDDYDDFSDPEDEALMRQLAIEAEEHARFASTLTSKTQLQSADDYERELRQLRNQQKKDRRDADEVSHIMVTECQQLLKLFGLPYITAPMEAEAQCAELVRLGLVDGIVTDDSDVFLFGGTRVYKNMFNQAKFVECFLSADLEKEYALDRHKVIQFAHLLGSDYAEGIPLIGPVTALEILGEFADLEAFRDWWATVQNQQPQQQQKPSAAAAAAAEEVATQSPWRRKFRKNAGKIFLPPTFPDKRVDEAYLHPDVDRDASAFAWGVPDLDALRGFLMATVGWTRERADEILVPVIRDMNRRENEGTQANITQFFAGGVGVGARTEPGGGGGGGGGRGQGGSGGAFAPRRREGGKSRRMEGALARLKERRVQGERRAEGAAVAEGVAEEVGGAEDGGRGAAAAAAAAGGEAVERGAEKKKKKEKKKEEKKKKKKTAPRKKRRAAARPVEVDDDDDDDGTEGEGR